MDTTWIDVVSKLVELVGGWSTVILGGFTFVGSIILMINKSKLDRLAKQYSSLLDSTVHVNKSRFDLEFQIYQELWASLVPLQKKVLSQKTNISKSPDKIQATLGFINDIQTQSQKFGDLFLINQPFFSKEVYEVLNQLHLTLIIEGTSITVPRIEIGSFKEEIEKNNELKELIDRCCDVIKSRLDSLSVI